MGSLNASGIPVVTKDPVSYRKRDLRITATDNRDDTVTTHVSYHDDIRRTLGSGSIVRGDGSVSYREEIVSAVYMMGRSADERVASADLTRTRIVELGDNQTDAVIPTYLAGDLPQVGVYHTGDKVVLVNAASGLSVGERLADTGSFD